MGFAAGFQVGWGSVSEALKERERKKLKQELSDAMSQTPEQSQGFTADQGDQLRAAAESGQYDIAYDQNKQGYTVTPKAGGESGLVAQQGVTDFMGKRTAGSISDAQVAKGRDMAVLDVLKRHDPMQAFTLQRQMAQDDMSAQRFGQEKKRWQREDEAQAREDEYRVGRERLLQDSPIGRTGSANQAATAQYEQQLATYNEAIKAGKSPQEIGLPPVKPTMQRTTPMQMLSGYADLIAHDYKYGKLNTDGLVSFQEKMQKVEQENYTKALLVAQNGGSPEQVVKAFNAAGIQIDPKNVSISKTKQANGPDVVTLNYKDERGEPVSIPVMAELEAYDKAKQVYDRFYQGETNRRGNAQLQLSKNADGRAATSATTEQSDKTAKAAAAVDLFKQRNPNATAAELEAVRRGVIDINPDSKNAPSEVKLAQAMVNAGLAPDMRSGLEMALTKKTQDPGELHKDFVAAGIKNMAKPEDAVASADKVMETMGYAKTNGRWAMPAAPKAAGASFASEADAEKAAKEGKIKKGDRITIGGKSGTWQ